MSAFLLISVYGIDFFNTLANCQKNNKVIGNNNQYHYISKPLKQKNKWV